VKDTLIDETAYKFAQGGTHWRERHDYDDLREFLQNYLEAAMGDAVIRKDAGQTGTLVASPTNTLIQKLATYFDTNAPMSNGLTDSYHNGFADAVSVVKKHQADQSGEIPVIDEDKALLAEILKEYGSALRMQTICKIRKAVKGK